MDPMIAGIVIVLGKYTVDKLPELIPVITDEIHKTVALLYDLVTDSLAKKGEREATIVYEFQNDPETYEKPFAKLLEQEMNANREFAKQVLDLVSKYDRLVGASSPEHKITVVGSALGPGSSVSAGGDIIGRDKLR